MIAIFIIGLVFFLLFRAIGTANDKSPIDRMGEMISGKPMEKKEPKPKEKRYAIMVAIYSKKHPILKEVWKRCNTEEKEKLEEAMDIIHDKKVEIQKENGTYEDIE